MTDPEQVEASPLGDWTRDMILRLLDRVDGLEGRLAVLEECSETDVTTTGGRV